MKRVWLFSNSQFWINVTLPHAPLTPVTSRSISSASLVSRRPCSLCRIVIVVVISCGLSLHPFYTAVVLLGCLVIADAHQQQAVSVFTHLLGILAAANLVDGSMGRHAIFQFDDDGG